MAEAFFDTNVLLYLVSQDRVKAARARELLAAGGEVSVQVLNEFAAVARRKQALDWAELVEALAMLQAVLRVHPLTVETHRRGLEIAERYRLAIYDALIIAVADLAGCERVYSEDMQDGMRIGNVTIRHPFSS